MTLPMLALSLAVAAAQQPPPRYVASVVFIADRTTDGVDELWSANSGGTVRNLSGALVAGGDVKRFAWSPNRAWIAFLADKDVDGKNELYVVSPSGTGLKKVSGAMIGEGDVDAFEFRWSSDSARVAFLADATVNDREDLYTALPTVAGAPVKINGGGGVWGFQWSPAGDRIAYVADATLATQFELYVESAAGGGLIKLSQPALLGGDVEDAWLRWSPDGSRLAYKMAILGGLALYTTPSTVSAPVQIEVMGDANMSISIPIDWSADSSRILYGVFAAGVSYDLFAEPATGGAAVHLNNGIGGAISEFRRSPDGARVAFLDETTTGPLYTVQIDGTGLVQVGDNAIQDFSWMADGSRVYFPKGGALATVGAAGAPPEVVVSGAITVLPQSYGAAAPNGSRIAFKDTFALRGPMNLFTTLPDGTGVPIQLTSPADPASTGVQSFQWRSTSGALYFVADHAVAGKYELWRATPGVASSAVKVSGTMIPAGDVGNFQAR